MIYVNAQFVANLPLRRRWDTLAEMWARIGPTKSSKEALYENLRADLVCIRCRRGHNLG